MSAAVLFALAAPAQADPAGERPIFEPLRFDPLAAMLQDEGAGAADGEAPAAGSGFNDLMSIVRDISNNSVEVRMEARAIQKDMKAARAAGQILLTQATTRDFEDDFGMDLDPQVIINPFIDWRIDNNVVRMSWWQYSTDGKKTVAAGDFIAFGDQTYDPGTPIEGDMTLWDTKLGYEYRIINNDYGQIFTGISLVYMRADAEFTWRDNVFGFRSDGTVIDDPSTPGKVPDTDAPFEHFGLVAISIRMEGKITESVFATLDVQSLAIPFVGGIAYSYADFKAGMAIEITRFTRLSVGYRYYDARLNLDEFGSKKTDFYGRFKLTGGWASFAVVFP
ncbi:MAG: hypothetical protein ACYTGX_06265 [Planctomycetota bacterium]